MVTLCFFIQTNIVTVCLQHNEVHFFTIVNTAPLHIKVAQFFFIQYTDNLALYTDQPAFTKLLQDP